MENKTKWTAVFGRSPSQIEYKPENYAKDMTLRYPVPMPFDCTAVRLHFTNRYGTEPVTLSAVTAAKTGGKPMDILGDTVHIVTFSGKSSYTMAPGESIVSDPVKMDFSKGEQLSVSLWLGEFTPMIEGCVTSGPLSKRYFIAGNHVSDEKLPYGYVQEDRVYRFFYGADALTGADKRSVIMFGDSITALSWPELLEQRCAEEQPDTAVIRRAVSGSRVLRQYEVPIYRAYGASGPVRFVQECTTAGADTVVILHGINDIIHPDGINPVRPMSDLPTKEELIDGFRQYIAWARELGLRVYLCTILPIEGWRTYLPFREELRCAVNDWIRTQTEADGIVDFDLVMRREDNPSAMQEQYDSGDHLHPSAKGNQIMSDCVYEALFQNGGQNV